MIHEIYRGMLCLVLVRELLFFFVNMTPVPLFFLTTGGGAGVEGLLQQVG